VGYNSYTRHTIIIRTLTWIRNQLTVINSGGTDLLVRAPMKQLRIPPLLADIIQSGILACEGILFDNRDACPVCGGPVSGYDTRKKQFAVMLRDGIPNPLHVQVKRFCCRQCGLISFADEPFYKGTRHGSPVVDLCRTLSTNIPYHRAAAYMTQMGIVIDRGTVRNYARGSYAEIPTSNLFGVRIPLSVISLSSLTAKEGSRIKGAEALAACGFPSAYRAAPDLPLFPEQRDEGDNEESDKER